MADENAAEPTRSKKTPLYELHRRYGAKMVDFAGYSMPVHFADGIIKEHLHTREAAALFDVSHMGQITIGGTEAAKSLEALTPANLVGLTENCQRYVLITNERGGILDDLMVTNAGGELALVVNASRKTEDLSYLESSLGGDCEIRERLDRALIALQGPAAAGIMARVAPASGDLVFMRAASMKVAGIDAFVSRSGYTGEDGFELSVPAAAAMDLAEALLGFEAVRPAGLGARDSLRLEAGLCLYGQDLDEDTTPVEAGLEWALARVRRRGGRRPGGYPGFEVIARQLEDGVARVRVGILAEGRAPVRGGTDLVDNSGSKVGKITSGGYGASTGGPVAMGYVESSCASEGTRLDAVARGRARPVKVAKLPFVRPRYYRG